MTAKPETMSQARTWDTVKAAYLRAGLCHACAGQAAWGHQLGFGHVSPPDKRGFRHGIRPPCDRCRPLVAAFPVAAPAGWRRFARGYLAGRPLDGPEKPADAPADADHGVSTATDPRPFSGRLRIALPGWPEALQSRA